MNVSANNYVAIANDSTAMACSIGYNKAAHSVTYGDTSSCDANVIIINWDDADGNIFETNSCTYDGSITTPTTSPTKRGHAFTGWTFVGQ